MPSISTKSSFILGTALFAGLLGGAGILAHCAEVFQESKRSIVVRGLAEQNVQADLVVWQINFSRTEEDLKQAYEKISQDSREIEQYLINNGIDSKSISRGNFSQYEHFNKDHENKQKKYHAVSSSVVVRSEQIELVVSLSQNSSELLKTGVHISDMTPRFIFTKLNEVKPNMLMLATQNARAAAEQFAKDSSSKVGALKFARQGNFEILHPDAVGDYYLAENVSPEKKLRVVATLEYSLQS